MAALQDVWRLEPDGVLAAEIGGFRLVVKKPETAGALVRFLVLRGAADGASIIGSGTEADVRSAMQTASRMAARLTVWERTRFAATANHPSR
ncbi:hypothetical protein [Siccirubricoccus sp. G192]|uniref:hypothetical protein n=1 Tax=Siccirubricoccus sp. G192 TaxID=2849651 RepID=UPI001C2BA88D|nr:hypothetical protein [Siccirubricoccus sp. G192]MBV1800446.1 hypothetical protein [Siccirubricoccus sp. G192]